MTHVDELELELSQTFDSNYSDYDMLQLKKIVIAFAIKAIHDRKVQEECFDLVPIYWSLNEN